MEFLGKEFYFFTDLKNHSGLKPLCGAVLNPSLKAGVTNETLINRALALKLVSSNFFYKNSSMA